MKGSSSVVENLTADQVVPRSNLRVSRKTVGGCSVKLQHVTKTFMIQIMTSQQAHAKTSRWSVCFMKTSNHMLYVCGH